MDSSNVFQLQSNILFWLIIALFAWQGYQRGLMAELLKLGFIVAGFFIGRPDMLGATLVKALNGFWLALQFLIHGGLAAIATGNFNADTLSQIFDEIGKLPPLVPRNSAEMAMFLAMLFLIALGYLASKFIKPTLPGLGLVAGAFNGFFLSYIFLPKLPKDLPFEITDQSVTGIFKQLVAFSIYALELILTIIGRLLRFMFSIFGDWTVPLLLLLVVVLILSSIKPTKKKNSNGGGGG